MLNPNLLKLSAKYIVSIDPSINNIGVAVFVIDAKITSKQVDFKLHDHRLIESYESSDLHVKCRFMSESVLSLISGFNGKVPYLIIEQPPLTIYNNKFLSKDGLIARAQSVFKLFAVYGSIVSRVSNVNIIPVLPSQWQPSKKERAGVDIKDWSISKARKILSTVKSEHVADAINIGLFGINKIIKELS